MELGGLSSWGPGLDDPFLELPMTAYLDFILVASRGRPAREALRLIPEGHRHRPGEAVALLPAESCWQPILAESEVAVLELEGPPSMEAVLEAMA